MWLSARHALACIDFPEGLADRVPDATQVADRTPLDSYLVGKLGFHVHLFGFASVRSTNVEMCVLPVPSRLLVA
jgi:hypothetical protein